MSAWKSLSTTEIKPCFRWRLTKLILGLKIAWHFGSAINNYPFFLPKPKRKYWMFFSPVSIRQSSSIAVSECAALYGGGSIVTLLGWLPTLVLERSRAECGGMDIEQYSWWRCHICICRGSGQIKEKERMFSSFKALLRAVYKTTISHRRESPLGPFFLIVSPPTAKFWTDRIGFIPRQVELESRAYPTWAWQEHGEIKMETICRLNLCGWIMLNELEW